MVNNKKDTIFSTKPVKKCSTPPVIIVGLPRSGSSFLSDLSSQLDDWFIFDDLYLYREAQSINAIDSVLTDEQLDKLLFFLGWQIRARIKFGVFCVPKMELDDVDPMNEALKETFKDRDIYWYELQEEWMGRLAQVQGCENWGYKAPQDFQISHIYEKCYPGVKYMFLYRDPRKMLRSLKFVNDQNGYLEQYHPVVYSQYWKKAIVTMKSLNEKIPDRILVIKYENLIKNVQLEATRIANFLNTTLSSQLETSKTNTSFGSDKRQELTLTEIKICETIIGPYLSEYGYNDRQGRFSIIDLPDLIKTSFVFTVFQIKRFATSRSAQVSILMYIKGILKK